MARREQGDCLLTNPRRVNPISMSQTPHTDQQHRAVLQNIAHRAMLERGLLPNFSDAASAELRGMQAPASANAAGEDVSTIRDLTGLLWASIDNDDSRDLDKLTVAEALSEGAVTIRVAVADVDALVKDGSAIDAHARHNTTSVYTAARIFPMLPEPLSTDLTSPQSRRGPAGRGRGDGRRRQRRRAAFGHLRARVRNRAKLAYNGVAAWLDGMNADGTRDTRISSPFGPYVDRLLIPQLRELVDVYGIDGAWIDGECWAAKHDYSPAVVERFRAATGVAEVPRKPGDPHWFEWTEFNRQGFRDYVRHYADALHAHAPAFQLTSNWAFSDHMPEPVRLPLDFLSGDFSLNDSVNSARLAGRCLAGQGVPWDLMAWSFGGRFDEAAWTQKSVPQLQREAAIVLALGGGFQAYFTQTRDAAVRTWQMPLMREVAAFARARQRFCHKATPVPQVALVYPGSAYYRMNPRLFAPYGGELTAMRGILQNLLDAQQAVEIAMEHHLRGRMGDYPLIVYPEWPTADESFRRELLDYVRAGGSLLVVGAKAGRLFDDVSGVVAEGAPFEGIRWLEHDGQLAALKTVHQGVAVTPGVGRVGSIHDRHDFTEAPSPAATITPLGRGRLAIVWVNLGERYLNGRTLEARGFLASLASRLFPEPIVRVTGSRAVDVTVMRLGGRLHVHLVNTAGPHEDADVYAFDEIPPVGPLEIALRLPAAPSRIVRQPSGDVMPFTTREGRVVVAMPRLELHDVIVVE